MRIPTKLEAVAFDRSLARLTFGVCVLAVLGAIWLGIRAGAWWWIAGVPVIWLWVALQLKLTSPLGLAPRFRGMIERLVGLVGTGVMFALGVHLFVFDGVGGLVGMFGSGFEFGSIAGSLLSIALAYAYMGQVNRLCDISNDVRWRGHSGSMPRQ